MMRVIRPFSWGLTLLTLAVIAAAIWLTDSWADKAVLPMVLLCVLFLSASVVLSKAKAKAKASSEPILDRVVHVPQSGIFAAWLVLMTALLITATATMYMLSNVKKAAELNFIAHCDDISRSIVDKLDDYARALQSGVAFFAASDIVTREKWHLFVEARKFEQELPGIQGMGFSLMIPRSELARHIQEVRSEGFPEYNVTPPGDREFYSPTIYLEPFADRNLRAFGFDMLSEPVRRKAMEQARDTGSTVLSAPVVLVQETAQDVQAGTLMYAPVYRNGMPADSIEQRRAAIFGWVYNAYRMNDLLRGVLGIRMLESAKQLNFKIFDGEQPLPENVLYFSCNERDENLPSRIRFARQATLDFNEHHWTLHFTQARSGFFTLEYIKIWFITGGGVLVALLLFSLIRILLSTRAKAQSLAEKLTVDLRASEAQYRAIIENSPISIQVVDNQGFTLQVNPAHKALFHAVPPAGFSILDDLSRKNLELEGLVNLVKKGEVVHFPDTYYNAHDVSPEFPDAPVWIHAVAFPIVGSDGAPDYFVFMHENIVERKLVDAYRKIDGDVLHILNVIENTHDALQSVVTAIKEQSRFDAVGIRLKNGDDFPYFVRQGFSEDFLLSENTLLEHAADGVVHRDKDGHVQLVCTCGLVISGKTDPANPLFTRGGSFWTNDSIPLLELPPDQDPRHHPRNQCMHYGYASMALVPIRDKEEVVGLIHINDHRKGRFSIADIQQLEGIAAHIGEALVRKRSEEHVRGLLEESNRARLVLLGILDDETRVRADFRRLAMAIDQTTEAVMVTDTHGLIQYVNPAFEVVTGYTLSEVVGQNPRILKSGQHSAAFYHEMWGTISSGNVWKGRLLNRKKNGAIYTEEATIAPVRDGAGGITNYVSVRRDITENLSMHAQLEQSQKMESVGRLAGGVAHDFNNILQSILGTVQLAIEQPGIIQQARLDLEEIQSSARRAAALTRQLLAFASKQVIAPQNIDLNKLIPGMLSMLNRIIGENINLVWTPGDGLWPVWVDPSQIDQILANFLVNARDAIEDVGAVHITTENVCVDEITALQHEGFTAGDYVLLMVSDTGHGMDAATLARIFEPFFTTKEVGKGTGLGLATVYGIVRQNKGRVAVYSEPGKGTTFRIYLQRYSGTANTPVDLPDPKVVRGSETILLVEDDTSILNMVERTLRGLGYNVLAAATPQVALRTADEYAGEIQLLLTDVIMPGMNGNELAKQITARRSNLHCIFMSGFPAELIAKQGVLVEGVKFLQKPFVLEKLAAKIREALAEATPA